MDKTTITAIERQEIKDIVKKAKKYCAYQKPEATFVAGSDEIYIEFRLTGNHGIDETPLEQLKKYCIKHKFPAEIKAEEWCEADGYYWDSSEDDE